MDTIVKVIRDLQALIEERDALRERVAVLEAIPLDNRRKLTANEVSDIRAAHRGGMSQRDLAHAYQVNPATISRTVRGLYH